MNPIIDELILLFNLLHTLPLQIDSIEIVDAKGNRVVVG